MTTIEELYEKYPDLKDELIEDLKDLANEDRDVHLDSIVGFYVDEYNFDLAEEDVLKQHMEKEFGFKLY